MSRYLVTGSRPYEGYQPGEEFVGELEPAAAARAIARGAIELVDSTPVKLDRSKVSKPAPTKEPVADPVDDGHEEVNEPAGDLADGDEPTTEV